MATKLLSDDVLNKLMDDVNNLNPDQLKVLAKEYAENQEKARQRRKEYHKNKTPDQIAKQREYMKTNNAKKREREKLVLSKARELGLIDDKGQYIAG